MRLKLSILFNILFFHTLFSFTVKDIPDTQLLNQPKLINYINNYIEPFSRCWIGLWNYPVSKDSVKSGILRSVSLIDKKNDIKTKPAFILLKSLLYHYLYQLEVDSAFNKADSLLLLLMRSYPDIPQAAWLRGVHLVRGSRITEGFKILDSLRIGALIDNPGFLVDIKELSVICFLPAVFNGSHSTIYLQNEFESIQDFSLEEDELTPKIGNWRIVEQMKNKNDLSLFLFGCTYIFKPTMLLRYPENLPLKLDLNVSKEHLEKVRLPLAFEVDKLPCEAVMEITADVSNHKDDQVDYLYSFIGNKFDVVRIMHERMPSPGISIRCYKRSIYSDLPGEFNAFAVFDLKLRKNRTSLFYCGNDAKSSSKGTMEVRYLISMMSSTDVENKAEIIFRNMLNQFTRWE